MLAKVFTVRKVEIAKCHNCLNYHPMLQYRWLDDKGIVQTSCSYCHDRRAEKRRDQAHKEYEIAQKKIAQGDKLTHWDKRIIGAYESWRDQGTNYNFLVQVTTEVRAEKEKWKKTKGYK